MQQNDLFARTRKFHIDVIVLCRQLPKDPAGWETGRQLIRSSGSVGANYRACRRAKSDADFLYKTRIVLEEADESEYWLGVIRDAALASGPALDLLIQEAGELTAIFSASEKKLKARMNGTN